MTRRTRLMIWIPAVVVLALVGAIALARVAAGKPSEGRDWAVDHAVAPRVEWDGDTVTIYGFRRFRHDTSGFTATTWDTVTLDLTKLERVWFVLVPFGAPWMKMAHSYVTFGFADSQYVSVSIEARRQLGESFGILPGLTHRLELIYIIGDENDIVRQRILRGYETYFFPVATRHARRLFEDMLRAGDRLRTHPQFYDILARNCTSLLADHVNAIVPGRVPKGLVSLFPSYADRVAERVGLIAEPGSRGELRERFRVTDLVRQLPDDEKFSRTLRDSLERRGRAGLGAPR